MKDTIYIPKYTIGQKVYMANYDEFSICVGQISKRIFYEEKGEYRYIFQKIHNEEIEVEESDIFLSFEDTKACMQEVVRSTLAEVEAIGESDVRYF